MMMKVEEGHVLGDRIRVMIAGKSPIIRMGLIHVLYKERSVQVIRELEGLSDVEAVLPRAGVDVVIIENSFAMWAVLDLLKKLDGMCDVPILIVSERTDGAYISSLLSAGAAGIHRMSEPLDLLLPALRKVNSGGTYLSATLSQEVMECSDYGGGESEHLGIDQLSERELQLFELMGMGYDTNEIGEKLHIGTKTVETHRRHIRHKLGSNNTSELLRRAISWVVQASPG